MANAHHFHIANGGYLRFKCTYVCLCSCVCVCMRVCVKLAIKDFFMPHTHFKARSTFDFLLVLFAIEMTGPAREIYGGRNAAHDFTTNFTTLYV